MLKHFVTEEGGLTGAGYGLFIATAVICLLIAVAVARRNTKSSPISPKRLAFCAMGIALAFITSYIRFLKLPMGGTITLFSMLFIVLVGYWYGCLLYTSQTSADFIELQTPAITAEAGRSIRVGISGRYSFILPIGLSVVAHPCRDKPDAFSITWP